MALELRPQTIEAFLDIVGCTKKTIVKPTVICRGCYESIIQQLGKAGLACSELGSNPSGSDIIISNNVNSRSQQYALHASQSHRDKRLSIEVTL